MLLSGIWYKASLAEIVDAHLIVTALGTKEKNEVTKRERETGRDRDTTIPDDPFVDGSQDGIQTHQIPRHNQKTSNKYIPKRERETGRDRDTTIPDDPFVDGSQDGIQTHQIPRHNQKTSNKYIPKPRHTDSIPYIKKGMRYDRRRSSRRCQARMSGKVCIAITATSSRARRSPSQHVEPPRHRRVPSPRMRGTFDRTALCQHIAAGEQGIEFWLIIQGLEALFQGPLVIRDKDRIRRVGTQC